MEKETRHEQFLPYGIIVQRELFETSIASGMIRLFKESPPLATDAAGKPLSEKRSISGAYAWILENIGTVEVESTDARDKKHFGEYVERLKKDIKDIMLPRNSRAKRIAQMQNRLNGLIAEQNEIDPNSWDNLNLRRKILAAKIAIDLSRQTLVQANQNGMSSTGSPALRK